MKLASFIGVICLLIGAGLAWHFRLCPEPIPQDPRIAFALDSLKADGARKDTLISQLLDQEPITIRIREQLPISNSTSLDSIKRDLLADPE